MAAGTISPMAVLRDGARLGKRAAPQDEDHTRPVQEYYRAVVFVEAAFASCVSRERASRSVAATLCQEPFGCTCAGSYPGMGRWSPNLAPWASIQRQTAEALSLSAPVTSTA